MSSAYNNAAEANRYDAARILPPEAMALWMSTLHAAVGRQRIRKVLDLGCGTGRFTAALAATFQCPAVGIDPSAAMLNVARSQEASLIDWQQGTAERIPLADEAVDLVFVSQVFHHLAQPAQALQEIGWILSMNGHLAIRNTTRENTAELPWLGCFPEALAIETERLWTRQVLIDVVSKHSFTFRSCRTISQVFASSSQEYCEKIQHRGLSSLIAISDLAFDLGVRRLKEWTMHQPPNQPVYESVDLLIFQKIPG